MWTKETKTCRRRQGRRRGYVGVSKGDNKGLWGGSEGVINFPWIFYAMRSLVPVGHFWNIYPGTYSLGLFAGLFSDAMGYCLTIVSCEMRRTK